MKTGAENEKVIMRRMERPMKKTENCGKGTAVKQRDDNSQPTPPGHGK